MKHHSYRTFGKIDKKTATQRQAWNNHQPVALQIAQQQHAKQSSKNWLSSWKKAQHWDKYEWLSLQPIAREPLETIMESCLRFFGEEIDWQRVYPYLHLHASDMKERSSTWKNIFKTVQLFGRYDQSLPSNNIQGMYIAELSVDAKMYVRARLDNSIGHMFFFLSELRKVTTSQQWEPWKKVLMQTQTATYYDPSVFGLSFLEKINHPKKNIQDADIDLHDDLDYLEPHEHYYYDYYDKQKRRFTCSYQKLYESLRSAIEGNAHAFSQMGMFKGVIPISTLAQTPSYFLNIEDTSEKFGWSEQEARSLGSAISNYWMQHGYTHTFFETLSLIIRYQIPVNPLIEKHGFPELRHNTSGKERDMLVGILQKMDRPDVFPFAYKILEAIDFTDLSTGTSVQQWAMDIARSNMDALRVYPAAMKGYFLLNAWSYHLHDWTLDYSPNDYLGYTYRKNLSTEEAFNHWVQIEERSKNNNAYMFRPKTKLIKISETPWFKYLQDQHPDLLNIYQVLVNENDIIEYNRSYFAAQSRTLLDIMLSKNTPSMVLDASDLMVDTM